MPNWEEIRIEWEATTKTYRELEEQFGVKASTIRSRKNREKWQRNATENATQQKKSVATEKKPSVATSKKSTSSNGRKRRSGNPKPKNQFTERNSSALKHGLFSRYIPQETLEIMGMLEKEDPADLIWDQIQIQYAAIVRAQEIMFVESKGEMIKELKKLKVESAIDQNGIPIQIPVEQEYEFQFAWDRHASFLNAQSRAISELRTSIRQFVDMTHEDDERRLKLDLMQVQIDKAKAETENLTGSGESNAVDDWVKAMGEVDG